MPTRFLRESICTSDNLALLSAEAERFWYRLIVRCDDFGRFDARIPVLRAACFPLMLERVSENDVLVWLRELADAKLLCVYEYDGRPFLSITRFCKHNTPRAKSSKYPDPQANASTCLQMQADASKREQIPSYSYSDSDSMTIDDAPQFAPPPASVPLSSSSSQIDPEYGRALRAYEADISMLSGTLAADMGDMWDLLTANQTPDWWYLAIREAVAANKRQWRYMRAILTNCLQEGHPPGPRNGTGRGSALANRIAEQDAMAGRVSEVWE